MADPNDKYDDNVGGITVINGKKYSIAVSEVKKMGLNNFIRNKKIFSYAITSPKIIKYTVFDTIK